jgi:two-component system, chemotaxis family, response regulator Rcp1
MQPLEILLVEDSEDDVLLIREALRHGHVANQLHVARNGDEAMKFMLKQEGFSGSPRADLVLLDLNLPGKDGREVLEEIKGNPQLRAIPVIVLTTSQEERDILYAYEHQANAYVSKPLDLDEFFAAIRKFEDFWLTLVRLPGAGSPPG